MAEKNKLPERRLLKKCTDAVALDWLSQCHLMLASACLCLANLISLKFIISFRLMHLISHNFSLVNWPERFHIHVARDCGLFYPEKHERPASNTAQSGQFCYYIAFTGYYRLSWLELYRTVNLGTLVLLPKRVLSLNPVVDHLDPDSPVQN